MSFKNLESYESFIKATCSYGNQQSISRSYGIIGS